jgi:hypothetical protein
MQIRKKGDEIKKKSSPLKLQSQSQPNFAEMMQLAQWFLRRRFLCEFLIRSYVKLSSAAWAILIGGPNCRIKKKSSPLKLLSQSQPNFAEMILG